ncbi:methionine--tRNA ligase [Patescibacteria group bacterium]|nr:methionine--tRNA ligase [Patescibacteria group bacterium]
MSRYITTTLPYVNGDPHIGHSLEFVQADTLARVWRSQGEEVFFSTGTDEHGQKIFEAAAKAETEVHSYVDQYAKEFQKLMGALDISNTLFVRTTDPHHYEAAQEMWRRCAEAGDVYEKSYRGLYCVGCEAFKTEHELDAEGRCILHLSLMPQFLEEKNYFFRLSNYANQLLEYLGHPEAVLPQWRREEAINFVNQGLEDISISREKSRLAWGVPVPHDDTQVMYVWFDALTSYLSILGWPNDPDGNVEKFWNQGETLQFAGKDQVRFQSILWQAMLMSAKMKVTDHVFYHGFINSNGQRMSKSLGNVISPYELISKYGTDATRYILLRHIHPANDSDVTWERLDEWYTAHLVNGLGNLVARVMKLAESYLSSPVSLELNDTSIDDTFINRTEEFRFNEAVDYIFDMIAECDAVMTEREPYKKVKSDLQSLSDEGKGDITLLVRHLAKIAIQLSAVMPQTSEIILSAVKKNIKPENLFPRLT